MNETKENMVFDPYICHLRFFKTEKYRLDIWFLNIFLNIFQEPKQKSLNFSNVSSLLTMCANDFN